MRNGAVETLGDVLHRHGCQRGADPALLCDGHVTSFAELDLAGNAVANALIGADVPSGARIGYLGKNRAEYFELLVGSARAGTIIVPIGWRLSLPEIDFIVRDANIDLLFVTADFLAVANRLRANLPTLRLICLDPAGDDVLDYRRWRRDGPARERPRVGPSDPLLQLYTSGTTGRPKGVVLSHANLLALRIAGNGKQEDWDRWTSEDVSLLTMPVAHVSGSVWGVIALFAGAKSIVLAEFDPATILEAIARQRVTKFFIVPAALQMLIRHPQAVSCDFSSLRYILYGGSPIPLDLLREAIGRVGCGFVQLYGMTETTGTVVALGPEDHDVNGHPRMLAAGRAYPGVELRIVDEELTPLPAGSTGEILIRSPSNMLEYWRRPDATREALVDGWVRTGDAGYLDADGYLFVQDRLKDMIITGGENVYPTEVENLLYSHPSIADVAVIGVPDTRWGEAVTAIVVPVGDDFDEAGILAWARERMAGYKLPKHILKVDSLPRNPSGKLLRREIRAPFWAGQARQVN